MLENLGRVFRANEEPENPAKYSETPVSKRVTVGMAGYGNALAFKLTPADLRALGWAKAKKSLLIRGSADQGIFMRQAAEGDGTHTVADWPATDGAARIQFKAEGQANCRVPLRAVAATIENGVLHIKPLPDVFLPSKPKREARVMPERPKSPAVTKANKQLDALAAAGEIAKAATATKRTSLEDITAVLALVNEARRELPYPTEAFVDNSGDVRLRVTL